MSLTPPEQGTTGSPTRAPHTPTRSDSPSATPPRSTDATAWPDPARKHITIAEDEVSATHTVPTTRVALPFPTPLKEGPSWHRSARPPSAGTTPTMRMSRGRRSVSSPPAPLATDTPDPPVLCAIDARTPELGPSAVPPLTSILAAPSHSPTHTRPPRSPPPPSAPQNPSQPPPRRWTPQGSPGMHPTTGPGLGETELARRSTSLLDWSFFRRPHSEHSQQSDHDEVSSADSANSAKTNGQRTEAARLKRAARSEKRRDTLGHHQSHRDSRESLDDVPPSTRTSLGVGAETAWWPGEAEAPAIATTLTTTSRHSARLPHALSPFEQTVLMPRTAVRGADRFWSDLSGEEEEEEEDCEEEGRWAAAGNGRSRQVSHMSPSHLPVPDRAGHRSHRHERRRAQRRQYDEHWTQVVLTVTSAIVFVVVVGMSYALYRMTLPYWRSIWSSVMLSIVLHPQSRLQYSLYKGTCIHRMERLRRRWARRGPFFGAVGAWYSLVPFASFVIMQSVFFFGLNKVERRVLVEVPVESAAHTAPPSSPSVLSGECAPTPSPPAAARAQTPPDGAVAEKHTAHATSATCAPGKTKMVAQRQRIVATVNGRRVLRLGMVLTLGALSHFLVGLPYLLLMHLVLFCVFALVVPLLPPRTFLTVMGRLWRFAMAVFLIAGLTLNLAEDVLTVSAAVRRTTTELVATRAASALAVHGAAAAAADLKAHVVSDPAEAARGELQHRAEPGLVTSLWDAYKDDISGMVTSYVQDHVLQELGGSFNHTNMTEAASGLLGILRFGSGTSSGGEALSSAPSNAAASCIDAPRLERQATRGWSVRGMWSAWFSKNLTRTIVYSSIGTPSSCPAPDTPPSASSVRTPTTASSPSAASSSSSSAVPNGAGEVDWLGVSRLLAKKLLPYAQYLQRVLVYLCGNLINFFDSIYALMLFVFFFRYLTTLEHTVLYYAIAKLLRVLQPEYGEIQARHIEQDITVSFITLLQSFWHLTWFHFSITFCVFKMFHLPTPFFCGTISVVLSIFPLVPKWLSPCAVAMVVCAASLFSADGLLAVCRDARVMGLLLSTVADMSDEWLLCVSRSIRGNFITDAAGFEREQLHPFVVGTALVLGFVAWGASGILLGPLTVIVAKVIYDNWDKLLAPADATELEN